MPRAKSTRPLLDKKFDVLFTQGEYRQLLELSALYSLPMGAIIRLALRDLHQKVGDRESPSSPFVHSKPAPPPPELDPFWADFRK